MRMTSSLLLASVVFHMTVLTSNTWALPDLDIILLKAGCSSSGSGAPAMRIIVKNIGTSTSAYSWLDIFWNHPDVPTYGELSETYRFVRSLDPGEIREFYVDVRYPVENIYYVDALVDSTERVEESNERNNVETYSKRIDGVIHCLE